MAKLRVGLLYGGRSVEHEVSRISAASILKALDPTRYDVVPIGVGRDGRWHLGAPPIPDASPLEGDEVQLQTFPAGDAEPRLRAGDGRDLAALGRLDVLFPIVHGRGGEDGALQGLLELAELPYVGSGVLGSAAQMDKDVSKRLLRAADIPVIDWVTLRKCDLERDPSGAVARVLDTLGLPVFVKPANGGSSVGTHRVDAADALLAALQDAARYDTRILVEHALDAREIEVAVIGNDALEASVPGEIRTGHEFYDYEAKYVAEDTELLVPAPVDEDTTRELRELAVRAAAELDTAGLARVDFLLDRRSGALYVNELNSLPGFTDGSMFPKLFEASGLPYPALLDRLIELALERARVRSALDTVFSKHG